MAASEMGLYGYSSKYFSCLWCEGGGVQGDGQAAGAPGRDQLYICGNSGRFNKIGLTGSRFLRGVAGKVICDWEYQEWQWYACLDDTLLNIITLELFYFKRRWVFSLFPLMPAWHRAPFYKRRHFFECYEFIPIFKWYSNIFAHICLSSKLLIHSYQLVYLLSFKDNSLK